MAFHVEKISDEDKEKFGIVQENILSSSWVVDREQKAYLIYTKAYGRGEYWVFDLIVNGVKIRAGMEPRFRLGTKPPYDGKFLVKKFIYPVIVETDLPKFRNALTESLKVRGYFEKEDWGGHVEVSWNETKFIPVADVEGHGGI